MVDLTRVWTLPAQNVCPPGKFLNQPNGFPKILPVCGVSLEGFVPMSLLSTAMARALPPISFEPIFLQLGTKSTAQAQAQAWGPVQKSSWVMG